MCDYGLKWPRFCNWQEQKFLYPPPLQQVRKPLTSSNQGIDKDHSSLRDVIKVKVKVTLVQALRLCTGRTAHRENRGIALPFHYHSTRRGWGVSVTPRLLFTLRIDPVPIVQEDGWAPGPVGTGKENLAPPGFDPRAVQPVASRYTDYAIRPTLRDVGLRKIMRTEAPNSLASW